ncbi:MAG: replication protein [Acidobacteriaceae bacterium]|jgi:hypothetical protein|nr:replication protein [Acidobacteriaceae bacterium]
MKQRGKGEGLVRAGDMDFLRDKAAEMAPRETPGNHSPAIPTGQSQQLSLWQNFLYNREEEREGLSNAVDLWDSVPRYSISKQAQSKNRLHERFLEKHTGKFQNRGRSYTVTITPARVPDLDGNERDFYPSATEELIEEALRKLSADQQAGYFDKANYRSGVFFSLYALREELAKNGHTRSYQEVRLSLDILSGSIIEIATHDEKGEEGIIRSAYLPSVVRVTKNKLQDDPQAKWAVQFHPLVTSSIDKIQYRQFNYRRMMSHNTQLARWLHKQLVLKFTGADMFRPFEMRYSTIRRDSGLLDGYARERAAVEALETAFKDLQKADILSSVTRNDEKGPRRKILDVVFRILPSINFVREVKAANKRHGDSTRQLSR